MCDLAGFLGHVESCEEVRILESSSCSFLKQRLSCGFKKILLGEHVAQHFVTTMPVLSGPTRHSPKTPLLSSLCTLILDEMNDVSFPWALLGTSTDADVEVLHVLFVWLQ